MAARFRDVINGTQKAASDAASFWVGHHLTLASMTALVVGWTVYGMFLGFAQEWFLVTNMFATLVALLILLLVKHARDRHVLAVQTKLDELIFSSEAKNHWIGAERHPIERVEEMQMRHHPPN